MLKKAIKKYLKNSTVLYCLLSGIVFLYLKFVYITSSWQIVCAQESEEDKLPQGALFALWHNQLAFGMHIFKKYTRVFTIASNHGDGKLIGLVIELMGYGVIKGSTNRSPVAAVKSIISLLGEKKKIVITPDGPRGPVYKINSNITRLANKCMVPLIPVACVADKYFEINSWDRMVIPKPFSKIKVIIGGSLQLSGSKQEDDALLEGKLLELMQQMKNANKVVAKF